MPRCDHTAPFRSRTRPFMRGRLSREEGMKSQGVISTSSRALAQDSARQRGHNGARRRYAFQFGASQELSFRTSGADLLLLASGLSTSRGRKILDPRRARCPKAATRHRVHRRSWADSGYRPVDDSYVPEWALSRSGFENRSLGATGESLSRSSSHGAEIGQSQGVWMDDNTGVIITPVGASFLRKGEPRRYVRRRRKGLDHRLAWADNLRDF